MKDSKIRPPRAHIIKRGSGWALKNEGAQRAAKVFDTKESAITHAKVAAKRSGADLIIHAADGSVQKWLKAKK